MKMKEEWARPELNRRSPRCKRDVITTRPLAHVCCADLALGYVTPHTDIRTSTPVLNVFQVNLTVDEFIKLKFCLDVSFPSYIHL